MVITDYYSLIVLQLKKKKTTVLSSKVVQNESGINVFTFYLNTFQNLHFLTFI